MLSVTQRVFSNVLNFKIMCVRVYVYAANRIIKGIFPDRMLKKNPLKFEK